LGFSWPAGRIVNVLADFSAFLLHWLAVFGLCIIDVVLFFSAFSFRWLAVLGSRVVSFPVFSTFPNWFVVLGFALFLVIVGQIN